MAPVKKKETGIAAVASSEPSLSENRTPKSLKPKPNISKESLNEGTLQVPGKKKRRKRKSFLASKTVSSNNEKLDANNQNVRKMKQKSTTSGENDDKNQANIKIKGKGVALQNKQQNEKNGDNSGGLENKQDQVKKEKHVGLQKKQHYEKNKQKGSGLAKIEHGQRNEQKHGQLKSQPNEKKKEKLGGLIFMCNSKTKPDCFRFGVMGVTMNKKELVLGIKPGLKLFLYDFDLRLLYGIYKASSSGGMKLEPSAFGGAFPVQVHFKVHKDCYPLPENVFRRAIKENYNGKNKFDPDLTVQQVKKLIELFRPAEVQTHEPPIGRIPMVAIHDTEVNERARESLAYQHREALASDFPAYDEVQRYHVLSNENGQVPTTERGDLSQNYFLSEKEYRTHGLLGARQNLTPPGIQIAPTLEPQSGGHATQFLMHPGYIYNAAAPAKGQATYDPQLVLNEKHYQTYGLFPTQELQSSAPLTIPTMETTIDSHLKVPYSTYPYGGSFPNPYRPSSGRDEVPLGSFLLSERGEINRSETADLQRREAYLTRTDNQWRGGESYPTRIDHQWRGGESYPTRTNPLGRRENDDSGMMYSTYASNALSEYNQIRKHQVAGPESLLAPVSSRYSFAGPSSFHH
ncbi:hypothetical protein U1Q18_015354 [Sarracenia purpurea var. burkii]